MRNAKEIHEQEISMKKSRYRKEDLLYNKWLNIEKSGMVTISKIKFYYERRVLEAKISQISCHIYLNKEEGCMLLNKRLPISGIRLAMECYGVLNEWGKQTKAHFQARRRHVCMHICMYICMYVCMPCMYVCMYVCVCMPCMHVCVCMYIYVYMYVCHIRMYVCLPRVFVCMYATYVCMYVTYACHIWMPNMYVTYLLKEITNILLKEIIENVFWTCFILKKDFWIT